jgi:peptide/nickel transport system permease protein
VTGPTRHARDPREAAWTGSPRDLLEGAPGGGWELHDREAARGVSRGVSYAGWAFGLLALLLGASLAAPWLTPTDPLAQDFSASLRPPAWLARGSLEHPLGTDRLGRDVAVNVLYGLRVSLLVGAAAVAISLVLGVAIGLVSGYAGGRLDALLMRAADVQLALPPILIALAVVAFFGAGLWRLVVLIGVINWAVYARTVRGGVLSVREREYVEAARALGAPVPTILVRHVLPNVLAATVVVAAVELPRVMLLEATLSFLGLGVPPTVPSLGAAVARGYQVLFAGHWWVSVFPGLALMAVVVCVNVLGDRLRDVTDPRHAERR